MESKLSSFGDAIKNLEERGIVFVENKSKSERSELMEQLYNFYLQDKEILDKKSKIVRKPISIKSFVSFWLSHIPTRDLYYLISIAKDKQARGQSFNKWLFWSLKN